MNKTQTAKVNEIAGALDSAQQELQELFDEIRDDFDGKSERWQEGEKGQATEELMNELESAISSIETAFTTLNSLNESVG